MNQHITRVAQLTAFANCGCRVRCGDDGDVDGPGVCKGLPRQPEPPLVEIVLVPRWRAPTDKPETAG